MHLRPVERRSVGDQVFDQLSAQVLRGDIAAGDQLPSERTLVDLLGVNRQAVREAIKRLEQAGLVDVHHGGGTTVTDWRRRAGLDLLPRLIVGTDGAIDAGVVRSIMEMRALVGPEVAARCAERAVPATVDLLSDIAGRLEGCDADGDLAKLGELDTELWHVLVDGADNIAYRLAYNALRSEYTAVEAAMRTILAEELRSVRLRRSLVAAVLDGDATTARARAADLLAIGSAAVSAALAGDPAPTTNDPSRPARRATR